MKNENRVVYIDVLRIISIIGVIAIHTSCQIINSSVFEMPQIGSVNWNVGVIVDSYAHFAVPVFLMISGALFLGKDIGLGKLFTKYILKLVLVYIFWSFLYSSIAYHFDIKKVLIYAFQENSRLSYICYLGGLYIISPILSEICKNKKILTYYLVLCISFFIIIPQILTILSYFDNGKIQLVKTIVSITVERMNFHFPLGMTCYYLVGYLLNKYPIKKKIRMGIYILGVLSGGMCAFLTIVLSVYGVQENFDWMNYNSVFVFCESFAVFLFIKTVFEKITINKKNEKAIHLVAKCVFGIYLTHTLILDTLLPKCLGINANFTNAFVSIPIIVMLTFLISFFITYVLRKIPLFNKYFV